MKNIKRNNNWLIKITAIAFLISLLMNMFTNVVVSKLNLIIAFFVLIFVIFIGIVFDVIGLAVATATEVPFHSKSTKKHKGARESIMLIRNADKVSSFCNDVIGDIAGVISGGLAATIILNIERTNPDINSEVFSVLLTAFVASATIGGKAFCKTIAINQSYKIVEKCGLIIYGLKNVFVKEKR
jgi:hypothetical protein